MPSASPSERATWVVTRERDDALPLVDALRARGLAAACIPCIQRTIFPWPGRLDVDDGALFFVTSPFAAAIVAEHVRHRAGGYRFAAIAPKTAAVLQDAGITVDVVAPGGAVALANAVAAAGMRGRVLYPTSDTGLTQAEQGEALAILQARVGDVVREAVYGTEPAPFATRELRGLGAKRYNAVLFSPSAARALVDVLARNPDIRAPSAAVVVGESTAKALPFSSMLAPRDVDIVDFIVSLERTSP